MCWPVDPHNSPKRYCSSCWHQCPTPKVSPMSCRPQVGYTSQGPLPREGSVHGQQHSFKTTMGNLWVGWGMSVSGWGGQCGFTIGCVGGGSAQKRWRLSVDCLEGSPEKGTVAAVPATYALASHTSVFSHMPFVPPQLLTLHYSPG